MKRPGFFTRVTRFIGALALLPVLAMEGMAVWDLLRTAPPTRDLLAFGCGFALWLALFHGLFRPFRAYVLAHELSHALWGIFTGARVSGLRISNRGGSVRLSEAGLFTTLAPYFLPLYTLLLLTVYGVLSLFIHPASGQVFWMAALGASWGFHVSFTISITLNTPQPDLREYGVFFSAVLILIFNLAIFLCALVILGEP
ncbi:MAG: hypothetical protein U1E27_02930, partial [Kiritimatiellia bacterium]|nr:hypothetical protein [Kiritimatiellia bacterium]